ncbi:MAG TPA: quinolinate phosphoribosyl transferase [Candidatus Binatia bacterium]|nr:quinolinate phosphoribosyl transferase [Candidatus Binatia bacterium]
MPPARRLDPQLFRLPVDEIRRGYYTDVYFNRARHVLQADGRNVRVRMQVFVRTDALLCGVDEALAILRVGTGRFEAGGRWTDGWPSLAVKALHDGDAIAPWETVMTIEGDYASFAHLETLYLGVLTRRTRIATNGRAIVEAAGGKDVLFFSARYDDRCVQEGDGYAAHVAGISAVSTDANAAWFGERGIGTIPHALIAAYDGDTVLATRKFAEHVDPAVRVIALVDYDNDCVETSIACARALGARLWGVRLDTSEALVDRSLIAQAGAFDLSGVNVELVRNVREGLDRAGFTHVKIVVSGGFSAEKIASFEEQSAPADAYAVGSAFFSGAGTYDFTADVVAVQRGTTWVEQHKVGRPERPNPRLVRVE